MPGEPARTVLGCEVDPSEPCRGSWSCCTRSPLLSWCHLTGAEAESLAQHQACPLPTQPVPDAPRVPHLPLWARSCPGDPRTLHPSRLAAAASACLVGPHWHQIVSRLPREGQWPFPLQPSAPSVVPAASVGERRMETLHPGELVIQGKGVTHRPHWQECRDQATGTPSPVTPSIRLLPALSSSPCSSVLARPHHNATSAGAGHTFSAHCLYLCSCCLCVTSSSSPCPRHLLGLGQPARTPPQRPEPRPRAWRAARPGVRPREAAPHPSDAPQLGRYQLVQGELAGPFAGADALHCRFGSLSLIVSGTCANEGIKARKGEQCRPTFPGLFQGLVFYNILCLSCPLPGAASWFPPPWKAVTLIHVPACPSPPCPASWPSLTHGQRFA